MKMEKGKRLEMDQVDMVVLITSVEQRGEKMNDLLISELASVFSPGCLSIVHLQGLFTARILLDWKMEPSRHISAMRIPLSPRSVNCT